VRDVAHVRDGSPPQTNIVRQEGHRAALMSILKTGTTSTLDVINGIKQKLPQIRAPAAGTQSSGCGRPVDIRPLSALRSRAGGSHGGGSDWVDGFAIPGQLA